jgi:hypothetical protein
MGQFLVNGLTVTPSRSDLLATTTRTGLYAVNTFPEKAFPLLSSTNYPVDLVLNAPGFRSQNLHVTILQNSIFPVTAPAVALRRLPVRVQGRVVRKSNRAPLAGASVGSVDDPLSPPPATHAIVLRSPLYSAHPNNTQIRLVTITAFGAAQLAAPATGGDAVLNFSDRTGLGPNSIVRLSNPTGTLVEYGVVDHLGPGAASSPGQVFLRRPINSSYAAGVATTLQFVTAAPAGGPAQLQGDADAGDGVLMATQLLNTGTLAIDLPTPAQTEYHELGALTDADGYYGISGVGRVVEIFLRASQGALNSVTGWFVPYDQPRSILDFQL